MSPAPKPSPARLILASSSPYRRQLLARLGVDFESVSPAVDETPQPGELPQRLVARLAEQKARAVAARCPSSLIIASDQVASLNGEILTKPGNFANAQQQLQACSGHSVAFYTSLALLNGVDDHLQVAVEITDVQFRELDEGQICRYLEREQPYDCAGSFKVESLGISLFSAIHGDDPNALVGLPLIRLVEFLNREGLSIP